MTDTTQLPESVLERLKIDAVIYVTKSGRGYNGLKVGKIREQDYLSGATAEATRAQVLIEALKQIYNMCDHDDYGNSASDCPACTAHNAIEKYNQTP